MATVFMKWLETSPEDYERGIQILTLGRLGELKQKIARQFVSAGDRVLEIGCGTGTLAVLMAENGAVVVGIDASPAMLEEAQTKIAGREMGERITIKFLDASQIADEFQPASFDLIVSTLVFSEIPYDEQRYVLESCRRLLAPGGRLLIADEVIPNLVAHPYDDQSAARFQGLARGKWVHLPNSPCLPERQPGSV
jgi:demethylmenaquinone methyltransferase/2-methoxy-6-polyprenyl-1,4-benzoquinol methylase